MQRIKKPNQRAEQAPYAISKNGLIFYFGKKISPIPKNPRTGHIWLVPFEVNEEIINCGNYAKNVWK